MQTALRCRPTAARNRDTLEFFRKAIAFTRRFRVLQQRKFLLGVDLDADQIPDLHWFAPDLGRPRWHDADSRTLCYQLDASEDCSNFGVSRLFFILNADSEPRWVNLPRLDAGHFWHRAIDTSLAAGEDFSEPGAEVAIDPPDHYIANPRSTVVLIDS